MDTQPRNKILVIIIAILLIANIATLSFFLMNKKDNPRQGRQDKKAIISNYLKNNVGFTAEQLGKYDTMSRTHRAAMRARFDDMSSGRENIFRELAAQEFNDTALGNAATAITAQQLLFETMMLHHLKDIRSICTAAQKPLFDSGFYKIISKRGEGRKNDGK